MNAASAREVAERVTKEIVLDTALQLTLGKITEAAHSGRFQVNPLLNSRILDDEREFVFSELIKLGYQIQTVGENVIISW
jgi:hypothetical protein